MQEMRSERLIGVISFVCFRLGWLWNESKFVLLKKKSNQCKFFDEAVVLQLIRKITSYDVKITRCRETSPKLDTNFADGSEHDAQGAN